MPDDPTIDDAEYWDRFRDAYTAMKALAQVIANTTDLSPEDKRHVTAVMGLILRPIYKDLLPQLAREQHDPKAEGTECGSQSPNEQGE
jgi:hypothetical protein